MEKAAGAASGTAKKPENTRPLKSTGFESKFSTGRGETTPEESLDPKFVKPVTDAETGKAISTETKKSTEPGK
jgi:hypothetical protein